MNIVLLLFLVTVTYYLYKCYRTLKKYPPGPMPLPIFGNILQWDMEAPHRTLFNWAKKYGPVYTMWVGNDPNIVVNDYSMMKDLLIKKGDLFVGRPDNYVWKIYNNGGHGIVLSDGNLWKEHRRFALHVLRDFGFGTTVMDEKILENINGLMDHIQEIFCEQGDDEAAIFDPHPPLKISIGNVILSIVLGLHYEDKNDPQMLTFTQNFDRIQKTILLPGSWMLSVYPFLGQIPLFSHFNKDTMEGYMQILFSWTADRIDEIKRNFDLKSEPTNYTEAYLKEMHERKIAGEGLGTFTDTQLIAAIIDLYGAGMDTTVTTLGWAILFLLHNPETQHRIQTEIDTVVGHDHYVEMSHRKDMPVTVAVINEVQRLANILVVNIAHRTIADVTIGGYNIAAGTTVIPQMSSVHMDPNMFTNPNVFNPDRFLTNDESNEKDKIEYVMPFSLGKRQCLGESLARKELFLILTALLQKYTFKPAPNQPLPSTDSGSWQFVYHTKPYKCAFVKRQQ